MNNNTLPVKMVVFETPEADLILESSGISKRQLKLCFNAAFFGNKGSYKDPMVNFKHFINDKSKSTKEISLSDTKHLANMVVHFGTKAVIGGSRCQYEGKDVTLSHLFAFAESKNKDVEDERIKKKVELRTKREETLAELAQIDQELGLYDNEIGLTE